MQLKTSSLSRERTIITSHLKNISLLRVGTAVLASSAIFINPWFALPFLLLSELAERTLYFKAVRPLKMPGFI